MPLQERVTFPDVLAPRIKESFLPVCVCEREGEMVGKGLRWGWGPGGSGEQPGSGPQILTVISMDNLEVLD